MSKLIRLVLVNDKPDGLRTLEISNMTIKATIFPRPLLKEFSLRDEAKKPGVYLLYGDSLEKLDRPILYIGEGDPVIDRLKTHSANKDFWTEAIVFTSKDSYLTKTQVRFLESNLILLAKEAGRVQLENIQLSTEPTLSEVDRAEISQFLDTICILASATRLNFFEPISKVAVAPKANEIVYSFKIKNYLGKMVIRDGQYVVLAGSTGALRHTKSAHPAIKRLRDDLLKDGVLKDLGNDMIEVIKDIPLNSASTAAAIICGGNYNGLVAWKYQGKTLKQLENDIPT